MKPLLKSPHDDIHIRPAHDDDSDAVIELIAHVYREYDGCVLKVDEEEKELRNPASFFKQMGGNFWVAEREGEIVGTGAVMPTDAPGFARLHKLFVAQHMRGRGLGSRLLQLAEQQAKQFGADQIMLYTDIRFHQAHKLYENKGYYRQPGRRHRDDASNSIEYFYTKAI